MDTLLPTEFQAYALAAVHTAILLALLWLGAWAVFWRGTTSTLARLDAELQRQKYQVSASEAEARRLGTLVRQLEERQVVEARYVAPAPVRGWSGAAEARLDGRSEESSMTTVSALGSGVSCA